MDKKLILIPFLIILFLTTAMATTYLTPSLTPSYTSDLNYTWTTFDLNTLATVTDTNYVDLNADCECWYKQTNGTDWLSGTWANDTNQCNAVVTSTVHDMNITVVVLNAANDTNFTSYVVPYIADGNTPTLSSTNEGSYFATTYYLTCADVGSGCYSITYSIDNGDTNTTVLGSSATINLDTVGIHTIRYSATDNVGNNRYYAALAPITIQAYSSGVCNLAHLISLALIGGLIITVMVAGFTLFSGGEMNSTVVALVATAIFMIIMIIIIGTMTTAICIAPV